VEKDKIKKDILKIANSLDTKSLESHLSRIRKKLIEIESTTTIITSDTDYIKLITPGVDH
jgi:DNA-binding response OmpR family regulator